MIRPEPIVSNFSFLPPVNLQGVQRIELKNVHDSSLRIFTISNNLFQDSLGSVVGAADSILNRFIKKAAPTGLELGWRQTFENRMQAWSMQLGQAYTNLTQVEQQLQEFQKTLEKEPHNFTAVKAYTDAYSKLVVEKAIWEKRKGAVVALTNTNSALNTSAKASELKNQQARVDLLFNNTIHVNGECTLAFLKSIATQLDILAQKKPPFSLDEHDWISAQTKLVRKIQSETIHPSTKTLTDSLLAKITSATEASMGEPLKTAKSLLSAGYVQTLIKESDELLADLKKQKAAQEIPSEASYATLITYVEQLEALILKLQSLNQICKEQTARASHFLNSSVVKIRELKFQLQSFQTSVVIVPAETRVHFDPQMRDLPTHLRLNEFYEIPSKLPKVASQEETLFIDLANKYLPVDLTKERKTLRKLFFDYLNQFESNKLSQDANLRKRIDVDDVLINFKIWLFANAETKLELIPTNLFSAKTSRLHSHLHNLNYVQDQEFYAAQIQTYQWKPTDAQELTLSPFQPVDLIIIQKALDEIWTNAPFRTALLKRLHTPPPPKPPLPNIQAPSRPSLSKKNSGNP